MRRFLRALRRRAWSWWSFSSFFPGFRVPRAAEEELEKELDADLHEEPREPLPDAEISETEREEAVRRYQRELREKGQR